MAFLLHHLSIFFFNLSFFYLSISLLTNVNSDLVDDVCAKTQHPSICLQALRSDPRTTGADLETLGLISIDISTNETKTAKAIVNALLAGARDDPRLENRYESCLENYQDSIESLEICPDMLRMRDYASLNIRASAAMDRPDTCDDNFEDPPAEPAELRDESVKVQTLCSIVCVISNVLLKESHNNNMTLMETHSAI
ncbi:hypothetical protein DM860_002581 [Cuscuta australis]|uniref:Pectinesterase inhibitor domain-containing protein n=1 Tax=Cuscuta australis TaxID=267555 RepID=A0A328D3X3_9ASTE|nr:hypothetical protein DM860_002581 [Cuscuta australis]